MIGSYKISQFNLSGDSLSKLKMNINYKKKSLFIIFWLENI